MSILLFLLWLLLNGRVTLEIVVIGAGLTALLMAFMTRFLGWSVRRERELFRVAPLFLLYLLNLLWETIKAAVTVLAVALTPHRRPEPVLVEFRSGLPREYQNVILANSITLTPGTITVFQEGDRFLVHALRREYAEGLNRSSFVLLLRKFP
ncbi:MAG: Na+/H+ antiporter subunit E [Oscillospiraceae bacterium]|nr:Na+/H+ antiporter subunit E [Oscillospiraceae bacterium]